MPIRDVWPFLDKICCCFKRRIKSKKNFEYALKRSVRKKLGISFSKRNKRLEADPFLHLGQGINLYLTLVSQLMFMMAVITCTMLPLMYAISQFNVSEQSPLAYMYTLGHIGGAETLCKHFQFRSTDETYI